MEPPWRGQDETGQNLHVILPQPPPPIPQELMASYALRITRREFEYTKVNGNWGIREEEPHYKARHGNGIHLIGWHSDHPVVRGQKSVREIKWNSSMVGMELSGKKKNGAPSVTESSIIAQVVCEDGSSYDLRACVRGKVVEINELLEDTAIHSDCFRKGYFVVVLETQKYGRKRKYRS